MSVSSAVPLCQLELYAHLKCRVDHVYLFSAERKIREAMTKERDASDLEKLAHDGERNIHRLCDQLLVNGRQVSILSIISTHNICIADCLYYL